MKDGAKAPDTPLIDRPRCRRYPAHPAWAGARSPPRPNLHRPCASRRPAEPRWSRTRSPSGMGIPRARRRRRRHPRPDDAGRGPSVVRQLAALRADAPTRRAAAWTTVAVGDSHDASVADELTAARKCAHRASRASRPRRRPTRASPRSSRRPCRRWILHNIVDVQSAIDDLQERQGNFPPLVTFLLTLFDEGLPGGAARR